MSTVQSHRRTFLKTAAAGLGPLIMGTRASGQVRGAAERVRIAVVGLNGRGSKAHIPAWLGQENVEIAYLVDPDQQVLERSMGSLSARTSGPIRCQPASDIRYVLDDPDVDAVSIATPNHWHTLMTVWAAQSGKHVYVEKPLSHDIHEGRVAVEAQQKYGVVIQHGTQRRSNAGIAALHQSLHNGTLPRLKVACGYACKPRRGIGHAPDTRPPATLDWGLWKGPAVLDAFHTNLVHYNWHWFWETGNGELNNQGTHQLDVARWAIDPDQTHPTKAIAIGGRFKWGDQGETPNTLFAAAEYPNGQSIVFHIRNVDHPGYKRQVYNEYLLEDGSRIVGEGGYKIYRPGSNQAEDLSLPPGNVTPGGEWESFIAAVRAGNPEMANGTVKDAHYSCVVGHLMNNSFRLGENVPYEASAGDFDNNRDAADMFRVLHDTTRAHVGSKDGLHYIAGPMLQFAPEQERFVGDRSDEANLLLSEPRNKGYELPSITRV